MQLSKTQVAIAVLANVNESKDCYFQLLCTRVPMPCYLFDGQTYQDSGGALSPFRCSSLAGRQSI